MNGQVPSTMTYGEWLTEQTTELQNEALGIGKAQLFRDGKINVSDFVNNEGRILTLKELAKKAG
jgi:hypothetical protein